MISRPLDLASKLRPEPRNFDFLFYVNAGLIVLGFVMFGSRFVLTPGLGLDFQVPAVAGARSGAVQTTHRITVKQAGLIFTDSGPLDPVQLKAWLADQAKSKSAKQPSLLIIASERVAQGTTMEIVSAAFAAGFVKVQVAAEEPTLEKR